MKAIYTLIFTLAIGVLYFNLNKPEKISNRITYSFWALFVVFALLHIEVFAIDFLSSFEDFTSCAFFLLFIIFVNLVENNRKKKILRSNFFSEEQKEMQIRFASFMVQKVLYFSVLVFIILLIISGF